MSSPMMFLLHQVRNRMKIAQISNTDRLTYALHILKTLGIRDPSRQNIQNILGLAGNQYASATSLTDEQWQQVFNSVFKDYSSPADLSKARQDLAQQPPSSDYHREPGLPGGTDRPYYIDEESPRVLKERLNEYEELYERMEKRLRDMGVSVDDERKAYVHRIAQILENRAETVKEFLSWLSELGIDITQIRQVSELSQLFTHPGATNLWTMDDDEIANLAGSAVQAPVDESKYQNRPTKAPPVTMPEVAPEPQSAPAESAPAESAPVPIPPRKPAPAPGSSAPPAIPTPLPVEQPVGPRKPAPMLRPPPPPPASSVQRQQQFGGEARSQPTPDEGLQYGDALTADSKNILVSRPGRRSQDVARVGQGVYSTDKSLRVPIFRGTGVGYIVGMVDPQTVKVWVDGVVYSLPLAKLEQDMKGRSLKPKSAGISSKDLDSATITFRGDDPNGLIDMLEYIRDNAASGHSFEVVVDPGDSEKERSFGFDGDGAFAIRDIEVTGQKKEGQNMFAPQKDHYMFTVYALNKKALDRLITLMKGNPQDYDFEQPEVYTPETDDPGGFIGMAQAIQPQAPQVGPQPGQPPSPNAIPTAPDGQPAQPGDYVQPQGPSTDPNTQGTVQQVNPDGSMIYQDGAGQQKVKQPSDGMQVIPQA